MDENHNQNFRAAVACINSQEKKFITLVKDANAPARFKEEMLYASQAMMNNEYLARVAVNNPLSLRNAFSQLGASGLTLNPSRQLAYLVPRDGSVVLDVSWRGMVRTAVLEGAIRDCVVELVYSNDKFEYQGKRRSPAHIFNPFEKKENRGEFLGCYVEAGLPDGRVHVEVVTAAEILAAREASELWKRKKKGPWVDYEDGMRKKSAIKIARKFWPQCSRLDEVIQYLNQSGEGFAAHDVPAEILSRYLDGGATAPEPVPLPTSNELDLVGQVIEPEPVQAAQPGGNQAEAGTSGQSAPAGKAKAKPRSKSAEAPAQAQARAQAQAQAPAQAQSSTSTPGGVGQGESSLPQRVLQRVEEIVERALTSGAWQAARDFVSTWPDEARNYALKKLKAAEYQAAAQGA